ncbi:AhpC/TSA family protein [Aequorivita sp. H23M31]|uniref:AhpC/TSA family protein n=1 Tax=Aequorivita ciconiae TaxID=2494375 RepID=A0A410G1Z9_9FLAO|nr:TlpA disulfide reductase family protein [Aequorivita sp. H23M31]QAA81270.1 AhpC/TSA family protein [Aequorivita sp. H23M31]
MRQIFALFLTLTLTLMSCQKDKNTYTLEGDAVGFADGSEILVYTFEDRQAKIIDTLIIENGKFSGTYPNDNGLSLNFLRSTDVNGTVIYFPGNEDLKAVFYKDSVQASRVTGGKQNKAYSDFVSKINEFNEKKKNNMDAFRKAQEENDAAAIAKVQSDNLNLTGEETKFKKDFLANHDKSLFSLMLIAEMVGRGEMTSTEANTFISDLSPDLAATDIAKELKMQLEKMGKAEVGTKAPEFSAPTPDGKELALADALGKYTIIDFWASWCKPCRIENPNVVKVYNKYHDKGLNIISVSLDKADQKDKWLQAIKDDKMDWYHVSNLEFWNDPIAQQYSVRSIPATFLLDENGVIIDKNLRGDALEAKIGSLLGGE